MSVFSRVGRGAALAVALSLAVAAHAVAARLYQVSTIQALSAGCYAGRANVADLARHGDFGLGTLSGLDGEMVVLDGVFLQARADGTVRRVGGGETTPFAQVVFFAGSLDLGRHDDLTLDGLKAALAGRLPDPDRFYAVRVDGLFRALSVRSVAAQAAPWPPLAEALKGQKVFPLENVQGSMVGFYTPPGVPALSPPGWHFHFMSSDGTRGGHVLDGTIGPVKARGDAVTEMTALFPAQPLPRRDAAAPSPGTE